MGMKLEIRDLSVGYDKPVLERITMTIEKGNVVNFHGPNGIGKTTLLKTISTYLKPLKGEIIYNGVPITKVKGKIFFLPEEIIVPRKISVEDYLKAVASLYGVKVNKNEIMDALESVEVLDLKKKLGELSQGTIRRVQLASTLLVNAEIYVLDDPVVAIDEDSKHKVLKSILEILKEKGIVIISSREELSYCDVNENLHKYSTKIDKKD